MIPYMHKIVASIMTARQLSTIMRIERIEICPSCTMSTKNTYDCSQCPGYCCSYDYIETKPSDVTRLAKHHALPVDVAREKFTKEVKHEGETIRVLRHRKDHVYKSMCMFFDQDERRCTIYGGRPQVCRDYPNGNSCGYFNFIKFERKHQGDDSFIPSA